MSESQSNIEELLGVDQIRSWIATKCKSEQGAILVHKAKFSSKYDHIKLWLTQTSEMMRMISAQEVPNQHFHDLEVFLNKIKVQGTYLEGEEYLRIASSIRSINEWLTFFKNGETYIELAKLSSKLNIDAGIADTIEISIDDNGTVRDSASPDLAKTRKRLTQLERSARSALSHILKNSIEREFSTQNSQVTLRDGRLVIPIKAEFKRSISGLVHDESATGQTVYMEPAEALELNNEVRELKNKERREVIRILISLADGLRFQYDDLERGSRFIVRLDFIYAKAAWALEFNAVAPIVQKSPTISLNQAHHPILWKTHKKSGKQVVPLDITLDSEQRMVVVSGPNAGGKSVVLKTVGLLQYLIQCGIPVPVQENSTFGVFNEILLDIGDTQSIEDDLSTYSAHITAMKRFDQRASKRSLVLIDEFGKGTEPQFGGAIAEAILENLHKSGCFGVITTHYQNLKDLAENSPGMVNAAMTYDVGKLEPLFLLEIGQPGSSFAFEIARKIGLPREIIKSAQGKMGKGQVDFDKNLTSLEKEKQKYMKLAAKLEKEEKVVTQLKKDYEELKELLAQEKKTVIKEAKGEALRIVDGANKRVEKTIREIKEHQADKEKTKQSRKNLEDLKKSLDNFPKKKDTRPSNIDVGDFVKIDGQDGVGEILDIKKSEAQVQFGLLKSFVKVDRLRKVKGQRKEVLRSASQGVNLFQKRSDFTHELVIRGMRAEEALPRIDSFVDESIMLGVNQVKVVHGKGHGILRDLLRNHLSDHPSIGKVEDEHADRGGSGISVVTFK
ncbi:MAG: endonuclease MutS2 [Cytophagales bacterium]|nr:endonuclease MutS2 [Cytophagales bacterium]